MENQIEILIRQLGVEKDIEAIWGIRNHPENRINFSDQTEIRYESHRKWFAQKYLSDDASDFCFVLRDKGQVVGYCRFDLVGKAYNVSVALDPLYKGKGLGKKLLSESIKKMPAKTEFLAKVKEGNEASLKIFKANGFIISGQDEEFYNLKLEHEK